jgi:predicted GTPase
VALEEGMKIRTASTSRGQFDRESFRLWDSRGIGQASDSTEEKEAEISHDDLKGFVFGKMYFAII